MAYALFKGRKEIFTGDYESVLTYADKIGVLLHFGNIKKHVMAVGYEIKEV
jgi:hypothetical protein